MDLAAALLLRAKTVALLHAATVKVMAHASRLSTTTARVLVLHHAMKAQAHRAVIFRPLESLLLPSQVPALASLLYRTMLASVPRALHVK